jgi:hypothetical protein
MLARSGIHVGPRHGSERHMKVGILGSGAVAKSLASAIEPLCMLWCIPGFLRDDWTHAFKLLT